MVCGRRNLEAFLLSHFAHARNVDESSYFFLHVLETNEPVELRQQLIESRWRSGRGVGGTRDRLLGLTRTLGFRVAGCCRQIRGGAVEIFAQRTTAASRSLDQQEYRLEPSRRAQLQIWIALPDSLDQKHSIRHRYPFDFAMLDGERLPPPHRE